MVDIEVLLNNRFKGVTREKALNNIKALGVNDITPLAKHKVQTLNKITRMIANCQWLNEELPYMKSTCPIEAHSRPQSVYSAAPSIKTVVSDKPPDFDARSVRSSLSKSSTISSKSYKSSKSNKSSGSCYVNY